MTQRKMRAYAYGYRIIYTSGRLGSRTLVTVRAKVHHELVGKRARATIRAS